MPKLGLVPESCSGPTTISARINLSCCYIIKSIILCPPSPSSSVLNFVIIVYYFTETDVASRRLGLYYPYYFRHSVSLYSDHRMKLRFSTRFIAQFISHVSCSKVTAMHLAQNALRQGLLLSLEPFPVTANKLSTLSSLCSATCIMDVS